MAANESSARGQASENRASGGGEATIPRGVAVPPQSPLLRAEAAESAAPAKEEIGGGWRGGSIVKHLLHVPPQRTSMMHHTPTLTEG